MKLGKDILRAACKLTGTVKIVLSDEGSAVHCENVTLMFPFEEDGPFHSPEPPNVSMTCTLVFVDGTLPKSNIQIVPRAVMERVYGDEEPPGDKNRPHSVVSTRCDAAVLSLIYMHLNRVDSTSGSDTIEFSIECKPSDIEEAATKDKVTVFEIGRWQLSTYPRPVG